MFDIVLSFFLVEFHLKTTYDSLTDYGTQTDALKERFHKRLATFLSGSTREIWGMELNHGKPIKEIHW